LEPRKYGTQKKDKEVLQMRSYVPTIRSTVPQGEIEQKAREKRYWRYPRTKKREGPLQCPNEKTR